MYKFFSRFFGAPKIVPVSSDRDLETNSNSLDLSNSSDSFDESASPKPSDLLNTSLNSSINAFYDAYDSDSSYTDTPRPNEIDSIAGKITEHYE